MPDVLTAAAGYINQIATVKIAEPVEVKPGVVEALHKVAKRARDKLNGMHLHSSPFSSSQTA